MANLSFGHNKQIFSQIYPLDRLASTLLSLYYDNNYNDNDHDDDDEMMMTMTMTMTTIMMMMMMMTMINLVSNISLQISQELKKSNTQLEPSA